MKLKSKNIIQRIAFDGDLLVYRPSKLLSFQSRVEIPINIILDYRYRKFACISQIRLYVNKYNHGQQKPVVRILRNIYVVGLPTRFEACLLQSMDEVIRKNMEGTNVGLRHIPLQAMRHFYHCISHKSSVTRWSSLKVSHVRRDWQSQGAIEDPWIFYAQESSKAS
jgi:hypothetical protein